MEAIKLQELGRDWLDLSDDERRALIIEAETQELVDEFTGPSEALIAHRVNRMLASEQAVYRNLHALFDDPPIPRYIGNVTYHSPVGAVEGLLLEYIPNSVTLRQYLEAVAGCGYSVDAVSRLCQKVGTFFGTFHLNIPLLHGRAGAQNILIQLDSECCCSTLQSRQPAHFPS